jgi:hypothetical protein
VSTWYSVSCNLAYNPPDGLSSLEAARTALHIIQTQVASGQQFVAVDAGGYEQSVTDFLTCAQYVPDPQLKTDLIAGGQAEMQYLADVHAGNNAGAAPFANTAVQQFGAAVSRLNQDIAGLGLS